MNITYKDIANNPLKAKSKPMKGIPFSYSSLHSTPIDLSPKFNNNFQERPLKTNSKNSSFKGLFFRPVLDSASKAVKVFNADEFLTITDKHMQTRARKLFESVKDSELAKEMFSIKGNEVTFQKKTILRLLLDGVKYPFTILPADMLNGFVQSVGKIKPLEKWSKGVLETPTFKKIRQRSKIDAKVNALRGLMETIENNKKLPDEELKSFLATKQVKMFDEKTGSYDTKHERSLNRIVSGLIPAVFLANDAYNLSIMCDDNKNEANQEKKIRFKQESARVITQAWITLITMGAIQKYINKSSWAVMANVGLTALFTESVSRLIAGKSITKISAEKAKEINSKNKEQNSESVSQNDSNENNDYKGIFFKSNKPSSFAAFSGRDPINFKALPDSEKPKSEDKNAKAPLLSFENLFKGIAIAAVSGFALKGLNRIKFVNKLSTMVADNYKKLYKFITVKKNLQLEASKFDEILAKLEKGGFEDIAQWYRKVAKENNLYSADGKNINLGNKDKKVVKPIVDFIIGPVKFTLGILKAPYYWTNKAILALTGKLPKRQPKVTTELDAFKKSINCIGKEALKKNYKEEKFSSYVMDNTLKAFNEENVSGIANSDLANLSKTAVFAATLPFLMSDNYNMVMLKSNGQDKDGAELKYKERLVQESSRFFYSTLLISLFNNAFQSQYHRSLFGMSWVTALCVTVGEILNRKSVGVPVGQHTRDEIVKMENDRENASPFVKGYYKFMARLTGKKSLAEQQQAKNSK